MKLEFWQQRWHENQTGFHLSEINPYLIEYWKDLEISPGSLVFVPMCGKTLDLIWFLSKQYSVLGIEYSEKAVKAFFSEQALPVQTQEYKDFTLFNSSNINLLQGDFFKLDKEELADVAAVYDRASLVALPEKMRKQYVDLLIDKLADSVSILLVTLEYDQSLMSGPPFAVTDTEIQELYKPHFKIELLQQNDVLKDQPRFKEKGLDYMIERVYKIYR